MTKEGEVLKKLTDKKMKFVHAILDGKSHREAYKGAFNTSRMRDETIDKRANELFYSEEVKEYYESLHTRVIREAEEEAIVTAKEVLSELKKIAFIDISSNEVLGGIVKMSDKIKSLELLGKYLRLFTDKIEQKNEFADGITVTIREV